jgi:hypothetical protein
MTVMAGAGENRLLLGIDCRGVHKAAEKGLG